MIFGALVYWLVILAALVIAFNSLGLTYITDLLGQLVLFVPQLIVALLILVFGAYFARFVGNAVITYCRATSACRTPTCSGRLAQYAILAFVVLIALDQIGRRRRHRPPTASSSCSAASCSRSRSRSVSAASAGRRSCSERWWPHSRRARPARRPRSQEPTDEPARDTVDAGAPCIRTDQHRLARPALSARRDLGRRGRQLRALLASTPTKVELCLFDPDGRREIAAHRAAPSAPTSSGTATCPKRARACSTAIACTGPYAPEEGHRFNPHKLLLDPVRAA